MINLRNLRNLRAKKMAGPKSRHIQIIFAF